MEDQFILIMNELKHILNLIQNMNLNRLQLISKNSVVLINDSKNVNSM